MSAGSTVGPRTMTKMPSVCRRSGTATLNVMHLHPSACFSSTGKCLQWFGIEQVPSVLVPYFLKSVCIANIMEMDMCMVTPCGVKQPVRVGQWGRKKKRT